MPYRAQKTYLQRTFKLVIWKNLLVWFNFSIAWCSNYDFKKFDCIFQVINLKSQS